MKNLAVYVPLGLFAAFAVALGFGAPFFEAANTEIEQRARLAATVGLKVVPAELGNMAPLVGAAAMARRMIVRRAG